MLSCYFHSKRGLISIGTFMLYFTPKDLLLLRCSVLLHHYDPIELILQHSIVSSILVLIHSFHLKKLTF
jgi:hypothetical protein